MRQIFVTSQRFLAFQNSFQFQNGNFFPAKKHFFYVSGFRLEGTNSGDISKNKIHGSSILRIDDRVCTNRAAERTRNILDAHILSQRQINPNINVHGGSHDALHNGGGHADQHEADFFRFKGFQ